MSGFDETRVRVPPYIRRWERARQRARRREDLARRTRDLGASRDALDVEGLGAILGRMKGGDA